MAIAFFSCCTIFPMKSLDVTDSLVKMIESSEREVEVGHIKIAN